MKGLWVLCAALGLMTTGYAKADDVARSVWVNEAIVASYTYSASNFLERQKDIARYFTSAAWISYSEALLKSNIMTVVKQNNYDVSAVATLPPVVKAVSPQHWEAVMPVLVLYKNAKTKQIQHLEVTLDFVDAPSGQGVRGLAISSIQTTLAKPPCDCPGPSQK